MALVLEPGVRVLDASGVAVSGGQVRVYNANTTTLSSLYSDTALTVPLSNPVVCNSTGYPSSNGTTPTLIFAASANYDVAFLSSVAAGSGLLRSWEDLPALGSDSSTFSKDFTNSRFQVEGVAGTVWVEAGDADPDSVGGTGRLSGYARTQADSWTIDAALTDTTGTLKENSKRLQGVVATEATTLAAATSNIIPLPNSPAGCRAWRVDFFDMSRSAATVITLTVQLSFDGGVTYKSTNEYDTEYSGRDNGGSAFAESVNSAAASGTLVGGGVRGSGNKLVWGTLEILSPLSGSSSDATIIKGDVVGMNQEGTNRATRHQSVTYCQSASQGRPTHVKILANSGNIDCKYRVVPLRGFGET